MASTALQRIVRRGVAILRRRLGAISAQPREIDPGGSEGSIATYITTPPFVRALLYMLGSQGYGALRPRTSEEDAA